MEAKLYEITNELIDILENEDEDFDFAAALESLQLTIEQKVEDCGHAYRLLTDKAAMFKARAKVFNEAAAKAGRDADRLKGYVDSCLQSANIDKIESGDVKVSYRKSTYLAIEEGATFAPALMTVPAPIPNKTAIKAAIKSGQQVNGAELKTRQNIQIK